MVYVSTVELERLKKLAYTAAIEGATQKLKANGYDVEPCLEGILERQHRPDVGLFLGVVFDIWDDYTRENDGNPGVRTA
ncbi:hypothetical protein F1188_16135 [Roseospira marina]|uniref:Uncharacterized protein n=1 Tax=Roseospira marina TaxID=140057 RepID=A0A5M6I9K1_9PROT|nr:hypothetical protein [Roseospira marina]KAA5604389.1 hypothetical protein F1188_16135 [Roseospira marina]MBB5088433.1 hypothetical protein [Roseospira marina]